MLVPSQPNLHKLLQSTGLMKVLDHLGATVGVVVVTFVVEETSGEAVVGVELCVLGVVLEEVPEVVRLAVDGELLEVVGDAGGVEQDQK